MTIHHHPHITQTCTTSRSTSSRTRHTASTATKTHELRRQRALPGEKMHRYCSKTPGPWTSSLSARANERGISVRRVLRKECIDNSLSPCSTDCSPIMGNISFVFSFSEQFSIRLRQRNRSHGSGWVGGGLGSWCLCTFFVYHRWVFLFPVLFLYLVPAILLDCGISLFFFFPVYS